MNHQTPGYTLGFMAVLCLVFGTGVATVHYATRDMLAANEQLNHNRMVCAVFGLPVDGRAPADYARAMTKTLETARVPDGRGGTRVLYRHAQADPPLMAFTFHGMGFWDRIEGVAAMTLDLETMVRLRFLDHKETPGLGGRIEEPAFLDQFEGLQPDWSGPPDRRIVIGADSGASARHRVDAVTGATQTSTALMRFLNEELTRIRELDLDEVDFQPVKEAAP